MYRLRFLPLLLLFAATVVGQRTDADAEAIHQRARALDYAGEFRPAVETIDSAIALRLELGIPDTTNLARSYFVRHAILYNLGHYRAARRSNDLALRLVRQTAAAGEPRAIRYLRNYTIQALSLAIETDDCGLAGVYAEELSGIPRDSFDLYWWFSYRSHLSSMELLCSRGEQAVQTLSELIEELEDGDGLEEFLGIAYVNLSEALEEVGRYGEADAARRRASEYLRVVIDGGVDYYLRELANIDNNQLASYADRGLYDDGVAAGRKALAGAEAFFGDGPGSVLGEVRVQLARLETGRGNYAVADSLLDVAERTLSSGELVFAFGPYLKLLAARRDLALARNGDYGAALDQHDLLDQRLRTDARRLDLLGSRGSSRREYLPYYDRAVAIALEAFREDAENEALYERAWRIASGRKSDLLREYVDGPAVAASLGIPSDRLAERERLQFEVQRLEAAVAAESERDSLRNALLDTYDALATNTEAFDRDFPRFAARMLADPPPGISELRAVMDGATLLLDFFVGTDSVRVFAIDGNGMLDYAVARSELPLDRLADAVDDEQLSALLYDRLLAPALRGRTGRLWVIPDGPLWQLPFAALRTEDGFAVEDWSISYAYSARQLTDADYATRQTATERRFLGFGLSYDKILREVAAAGSRSAEDRSLMGLNALPLAVDEITTAAELLAGAAYIEEEATRAAFLERVGDYGILHLAMHGLYDAADPFRSSLIFASGPDDDRPYAPLSMGEVTGLDLEAELAILSACHTGAGPLDPGEGARSIARAFTLAGARTTLASNWEASDVVTHEIVLSFIAEVQNGVPLDLALQSATKAYLASASPTNRNPRFWANLVLTGPVAPLYRPRNYLWWILGGVALLAVIFAAWKTSRNSPAPTAT